MNLSSYVNCIVYFLDRAVAAGFPRHVIQRGDNREDVFFEKEDRKHYLSLLEKYADKYDVSLFLIFSFKKYSYILYSLRKSEKARLV
jgi:hypothetical protein